MDGKQADKFNVKAAQIRSVSVRLKNEQILVEDNKKRPDESISLDEKIEVPQALHAMHSVQRMAKGSFPRFGQDSLMNEVETNLSKHPILPSDRLIINPTPKTGSSSQ